MSIHTAVPSDIEPDSFSDLADDCREVSGVLAPFVIDLNNIPGQRGPVHVEISAGTAAALDGYAEYGA
jgi:hypothetical protein